MYLTTGDIYTLVMKKSMKLWCVPVSKENAEALRHKLLKEGVLKIDVRIRKGRKYVYLPTTKKVSSKAKKMEFEKKEKSPLFKEYAASLIQKKYGNEIPLPSSFDIIGDIAIVRIPDEAMKYKKEIGEALLVAHKNIKVACIDKGVKEERRIRDIQIIAGEKRTETVHKEHGIKISLDIKKVYYSPRLATERKRIAEMVKKGDVVIDMFAGVAPFSLVIATFSSPSMVYAIDKNPDAVFYAHKNVWRNKLASRVKILQGDAAKIVPTLPQADHIIMNLPHSSFEFFSLALSQGKMIHYYEIMKREKIEESLTLLEKEALKNGKKIKIIDVRKIGTYSPRMVKIGADLFIKENTSQPSQDISR